MLLLFPLSLSPSSGVQESTRFLVDGKYTAARLRDLISVQGWRFNRLMRIQVKIPAVTERPILEESMSLKITRSQKAETEELAERIGPGKLAAIYREVIAQTNAQLMRKS